MRQVFKCGHRGLGTYCHRCEQAVELLDRAKDEKDSQKKEKFKAEGERLLTVPHKTSASLVPAAPVPG